MIWWKCKIFVKQKANDVAYLVFVAFGEQILHGDNTTRLDVYKYL